MAYLLRPDAASRSILSPTMLMGLRVMPCCHQRGLEIGNAHSSKHACRPSLFTPGAAYRGERIGSHHAFEFLLVRGELEIGGSAVRRQRHINSDNLERGTIEMRNLDSSSQRESDSAEICCA